ncbi:ATP-dependent DNA helicase RecG [Helicobacter jaachi]|uniref:ATP-dependent DNA helicase RecG n=1 Tax=Helicobacter jaachi TaxID=1677920 RepID=A0A4V6I2J8_9HELI|nr:ATP-dependent DNA helicase RecG [Helicobacter jaachi]TLD96332.1 ATP-dependent DNA helicase RecG [Helicobacter jaachi]
MNDTLFHHIYSTLSPTNQARIKKLKVTNLLSFMLAHVPKSYTNTTLSSTLIPKQSITLKVRISNVQPLGFGKNARLKVYAFMCDFNENLEMIIFHAKPFHKKIYTLDSILYIQGKLDVGQFGYVIMQPKVVQEINTIVAHFKTTVLNHKSMQELCSALVTLENLTQYGIPTHIAQKICDIFVPTPSFIEAYSAHNALPPTHLNALKFVEIYRYLALLSRKKRYFPAKYRCHNDISSFIQSLPFALTDGQKGAIKDIAHDLDSVNAAKRLIMGDVGCGKTIVILCAVMLAYPHTSILMAPTTILATQLYEQAKLLLPSFVNIALITAKNKQDTPFEQAHFIIGTQALLYREFALENLALVMSDEQHRFGTNQRYVLEKIGQEDLPNLFAATSHTAKNTARAHVLQFSATPIPRTLAMINAQFVDLSIIRDVPFKKDISTSIVDKSGFKAMFAHLQNEVSKGNQAIIVYPLVEESEHLDYLSLSEGLGFWQKHFTSVYFTSGKDKNKQEVIDNFARDGSLLLATTLIEVGISLPRVSSIVIVAPERLGLATLHQLRGRVSRNGLKGYCFLYTNQPENERLRAFCKTTSGFDIAELDLKYRNSGDLLSGERQSGNEFTYFDMSSDEAILLEAKAQLDTRHNVEV